jgi:T5SS/PEP-CTERM-associated repeat protein
MNSIKRQGIAVACLLACGASQAIVSVTGSWQVFPNNLPIGPGDTDLLDSSLELGRAAVGGLTVNAGSKLDLGRLKVGNQGTGSASVVLDGTDSRLRMRGNGDGNRLEVGNYGVGTLTVSGGATLDGRFDAAACLVGTQFCNNFIGNAAGSDGTLTVTGAGSNAGFLKAFVVGGLSVNNPTFGTPGGVTTGRINILAGGTLTTDRTTIAQGPSGSFANGAERSFGYVTISGPGSAWHLTGSALDGATASMSTATHANATAVINISNGGQINLQQVANTTHFINLSSGAGKTDMLVTGAGSAVNLNAGVMQVGRGLNGQARLDVTAGGVINDAYYFSVGRGGSNGRLVVDGAGARITVNRTGVPGSPDAAFTGAFDIGRDGGIGQADLSNGGRVEVLSGVAATERARTARLGVGAASQGTLNMSGANTRFVMDTASAVAGGGPTEALNPYFSVGYQGVGYLNVSAGAKIALNGGAVSTVADSRQTQFIGGGRDDVNAGGQGFATLSGAGTELRLTGADAVIWIGRGPGSRAS